MSRFGPPAGVYVFLTQEAEFIYPLDHSLSDRKSALEKLVTGPMKPMGI